MNNKLSLGIFLSIFLISLVSAAGFTIELKPHYYLNSQEILVYSNNTAFDGISFSVIGENLDKTSRIVNLTITKLSSELLIGKFSNKTETLISSQEKILWSSEIIDTTQIKNKNMWFIIGVSGTNEVLQQEFYIEGQKEIILNNPKENNDLIKEIGFWIWSDDYEFGLLIGVGLIVIMGFIGWRYRVNTKLNRWRDKQ